MGNAINSLIAQATPGSRGGREEEECILLSEEHGLLLTCCWVSLKVGSASSIHVVTVMILIGVVTRVVRYGQKIISRYFGGF